MTKIVTVLGVLGLLASGRAFAANEKPQTTTTTTTTSTERGAGGDGVKATIVTESKSDGAAGETTHEERLTLEKHVKPDGNSETKKAVKTSHKSRASPRTHRTNVEEKTVRDAQGNVISYEKNAK